MCGTPVGPPGGPRAALPPVNGEERVRDDIVRCHHCGRGHRVPAATFEPPCCDACGHHLAWVAWVGEDTFHGAVTAVRAPVLVDLRAHWCRPCRLVSPVLERIARERPGRVKLVRVDVEAAPALARQLSVEVVPTLLVLRDGEVVARRAGAASAVHLRKWVARTLDALGPLEVAGPVTEAVPV